MNVKILCTCNDPDLIDAATLVFNSIRIGFPDANIEVFDNGLGITVHAPIYLKIAEEQLGLKVSGRICHPHLHHHWIEELVKREQEPFFICDTDVIFWKKFEHVPKQSIAGRLIPVFFDKFTKATTMPRLHTSLMYIDPVAVRRELKAIKSWIRPSRFNPLINPFHPVQIPGKNSDVFFDTCALLYNAIGGQAFTESQLDCYDHLNAGTWIKELDVAYPELNMPQKHKEIYKRPELAKGIWRSQNEFYAANRPASIG